MVGINTEQIAPQQSTNSTYSSHRAVFFGRPRDVHHVSCMQFSPKQNPGLSTEAKKYEHTHVYEYIAGAALQNISAQMQRTQEVRTNLFRRV